ncbi:hypothetical protein CAI21_07160 [Alkalilimnicola ehrlichii]|uniref:Sulfatase-modifying factor enzyme domain-containing protein n=1 Tax=Alkalilimnicola ehrlichii TaxID=351052 RepID=A0A3E0X0L2_9GAMM|nr:SUMF1/EgtB/PvdO family nonheme iron enzyme [Alkalilimnicola ehrlichii]RFA30371.1 hypothetical protein CAI21_07160 [Alkalilimnicola ehrlichii]RFA37943.1 hypothetical protein CAL65_08500 [Alkalilimnicola ehrlichii]
MRWETALIRLAELQARLLELTSAQPDEWLYRQFHPDLSPLGWHLAHCVFIEAHWIKACLLDLAVPTELDELYFPDRAPKARRGARLPLRDTLLAWSQAQQAEHRALLANGPLSHPLAQDAYIVRFLCEHHAQHLETMRMALAQAQYQKSPDNAPNDLPPALATVTHSAKSSQRPTWLPGSGISLRQGHYRIGSTESVFDNEQPQRDVRLNGCRIARRPVTNGEYLMFIEAGMYQRPREWSAPGREWLARSGAQAPGLWRRRDGAWRQIGPDGMQALQPEAPVCGLSWFEAETFARWAGGRLPHEYEWEAALRTGGMASVGQVWEWCANRFHPYPGFRSFPYAGYSTPWFDGRHYVLRGGSRYSEEILRGCASFRNFHTPEKRYLFSGCRLAYDA